MRRVFEVLQKEGVRALLRSAVRKGLRRIGRYPELTLSSALQDAGVLWRDQPPYHAAAGKPQVSIIVLTYNNLNYTRLCLQSIYACPDPVSFELIVVDNASVDDTPAYLQQFASEHPNVKVILNATNLGFSGGNNLGAAAAAGEAIIFLNNDTIVTPGWLTGLLAHLRDPNIGMVGPRTNFWGNESRIELGYTTFKELLQKAEHLRQSRQGMSFDIPMLALYCAAVRTDVFQAVGPLDEQFGAGMFEDDDYAFRLHQQGYRTVCAEDVFVHHWGKASFSKLEKERYEKLFEENRRKFENKWGVAWKAPVRQ